MKRNLGTFILASRCGAGAVVLALCASISISRADITVVNNTADATIGYTVSNPFAQVFTMGTAGYISSLTLTLASGSASSEVYVYAATSGNPPTSSYNGVGHALYDLGSVSSLSPTITGLNDSLSAGTYAIVLATPASWSITSSGSFVTQNGSSLGGLYYDNAGTWTSDSGVFAQMNLSAVPEVPMTGAVMGLGALAIAVGHTLRRKLRPDVSSIA